MKQLKDGDLLEKPFVIDFYADWCGPCKALAPAVEALSLEKPGVNFYKCNVDEAPELTSSYNIRNIPFIVVATEDQSNGFVARSKQDIIREMANIGL